MRVVFCRAKGFMAYPKAIVTTAALLILLLLATPVNEGRSAIPQPNLTDSDKNHALVIGINGYQHWNALQSPVRDAETLVRVLVKKYNFSKARIILLTDHTQEKPTLVNILTNLEKIVTELTPQDNLVLFFAGHSAEDDDGETYWIPIDGKKNARLTWLKHSEICSELFASANFKAKSFCLITDSLFSQKLIHPHAISLTPYDLRYSEKILEMALRPSREVIAFGDHHWAGDKSTDGLGLFTYYLVKALNDNTLEIIDFENLVFDESILFPITKIAGTKMLRGRIRTPADEGGQYVIAKMAMQPLIDIVDTQVTPPSGYPGDYFDITARTSAPADQVLIEIGGEKDRMEGSGTQWRFRAKIDTIGQTPFRVAATNRNDEPGAIRSGVLTTVRQHAQTLVEVQALSVMPEQGFNGDIYDFQVVTDAPAQGVTLQIGDQTFKMTGAGNQWHLRQTIDTIGTVGFAARAANQDGVAGQPRSGALIVKPAVSNVVAIEASPAEGYAGEEFTIRVKTDREADKVLLQSAGRQVSMQGSGRTWHYKATIADIGTKRFTAAARNVKGDEGQAQSIAVVTRKSPLRIPDISSVEVQVVEPGQGYAGDRFAITVTTSAPSETVYLDFADKRMNMDGSGMRWQTVVQVDDAGSKPFKVVAKNEDGVQGSVGEGQIVAAKKPAPTTNVTIAAVQPLKGDRKTTFTFSAATDEAAEQVILKIGSKTYAMAGSGTQWSLSQRISETGTIAFAITAQNEDGVTGVSKSAAVTVLANRFQNNPDGTITDLVSGEVQKRFIDNGDGTVTDRTTRLMWMKQPKQIALKWEDALEYCRQLEYKGITGWRLPTIEELQAITDKRQQNPALPQGHPFTGMLTHMGYWSKSKHKFGPKYVYQMNLWYGKSGYQRKDEYAIVWPVRYAAEAEEG
jgi:hypothetical protein